MLLECQRSCGCKAAPAPPPSSEGPACVDRDKSGACASWAASRRVREANPAFMKLKCAASCGSCDMARLQEALPPTDGRALGAAPGRWLGSTPGPMTLPANAIPSPDP